jgi:metallo-beta-lactamase class B
MRMKKLLALLLLPLATGAMANDDWVAEQKPFKLYGNSYYVGSKGLSAVLVTSPSGHILIDGTVAENAPMIASHVRQLGFKMEDIKLILNSHAHSDHAGGIAELQRLSGAQVLGGAATLPTLTDGKARSADPQFGTLSDYPGNPGARGVADGEVVSLGPLAVTAHATPGHTAGGTTWTWQACEGKRCMNMVYIDSLTAVSAKGYKFSEHPEIVASLRNSIASVAALPCDIPVTAHPDFIDLLEKLKQQPRKGSQAFVDRHGCRDLAAGATQWLDKRLASEKK